MLFDDAIAYREAQTGAASCGFGGEEGIKNTREIFALNAHACVGYFDFYSAVTCTTSHFEHPARRHGVFGVEEKIQKNLLQTITRSENARQIGTQIFDHLDVAGTEGMSRQGQCFVDHLVEIHFLERRTAGAREIEQIIDDLAGTESLIDD